MSNGLVRVLLLYPKYPATFWNSAPSARVFMKRDAVMPPLGLLTIAASFPSEVEVRLVDRNVRDDDDADWAWADVVFISLMLIQEADYRICLETARRHGVPIAVGGPYTHARPDEVAAEADWVCYGEAEEVIDELIADILAGRRGGRYEGSAKTDVTTSRVPRFDLLPDPNAYTVMPIQFSRGCPFNCEFCDIIEIYGRVPRTKTPGQVLAELSALRALDFRGVVFIVDDNFIGNRRKAKELLAEVALWNDRNGAPYRFFTEASLNLAEDDDLCRAMAKANFIFVFIGIETPDPALLKTAQKLQNIPGDPIERIDRIRSHGVDVTAGMIVGFDGETRAVFEGQRRFLQDAGIGVAMLGLLEAIPNTQLERRLRREGRLLEDRQQQGGLSIGHAGMNYVPKGEMTKREYLARYAELLRDVYDPKAYFDRIRPVMLRLRKTIDPAAMVEASKWTLPVVLRQLYWIGLRGGRARWPFWKTLLSVMWKNPAALETFGMECFFFHHVHGHAKVVRRQIAEYLASPARDDVLDEVVPIDAPPPPTDPTPAAAPERAPAAVA